MASMYLIKWPASMLDAEITGTTVQYLPTGEVEFANEMLSPGMELFKWRSQTDYMERGIAPSLPLLQSQREYTVSATLIADRKLAVQLRITFFNRYGEKLLETSSAELTMNVIVPEGTTSYEIGIVNLKHEWIKFDHLLIKETDDQRKVDAKLRHQDGLVTIKPETDEQLKADLKVFIGLPKTIELSGDDNKLTIQAYLDPQHIDVVLDELRTDFAAVEFEQINYFLGSNQHLKAEIANKLSVDI